MALSHVNSVNSWNAPSTSFRLHYEYVQAHAPGDGSTYGGWTIRAYMQAVNLGSTSSWLGYHGSHHGYYNRGGAGWERFGLVEGNPFLASGVGNGAERWLRGSWYRFNANADGYLNGTSLTLSLLQEIYVVAQSPRWISNTLSGGSEYASGSWSTTLPRILQKPGAPTAVTVGTRTDSTIALTWTAPASNGGAAITSYIVDYAKNSLFTDALSMTATSTSTTLTGLDLSTYYVRVRAKNSVGEGAQSAVVQTATVTYPTAPPAPVAHTRTSTTMYLTLTDSDYVGDGILERQLERALTATGSWTNVPVTMPDTLVSGLTRATLYYYRFRVRNSVGWSPWATATARTLAEKPSAPTGYTVTDIAYQSALLNLGLVSDTGGSPLSGIRYEVTTTTGTAQSTRTLTSYSPAWISWTAAVGQRVRMAVLNSGDGAQWSDWGAWVGFSPNLTVPNAAALALTVLSDTSIKSDWVAPTILNGSEIWGYRLRLSTTSEFTFDSIVVDLAATTLTHTFTGLQPGTKYYSQIYAISSNGPGTRNTPAAEATTTGVAPTAQPLWMRVAGTWRPGNLRMRVAGTWRSGVLWENINGTWRKYQ